MPDPLQALIDAPEEVNPALALAWDLCMRELRGQLDVATLVGLAGEIDSAAEAGEALHKETDTSLHTVKRARPNPSAVVPQGF